VRGLSKTNQRGCKPVFWITILSALFIVAFPASSAHTQTLPYTGWAINAQGAIVIGAVQLKLHEFALAP
jgi:hypothetical protein